jgi:hypothetical protein
VIELSITRLVQSAPTLDQEVIDTLLVELRANGSPLALSIARVVELVGEGLVDPGIALPALASACSTLLHSPTAHEAARYEIETLLPVPDKAPKLVVPDVPLTSLSRGPRR